MRSAKCGLARLAQGYDAITPHDPCPQVRRLAEMRRLWACMSRPCREMGGRRVCLFGHRWRTVRRCAWVWLCKLRSSRDVACVRRVPIKEDRGAGKRSPQSCLLHARTGSERATETRSVCTETATLQDTLHFEGNCFKVQTRMLGQVAGSNIGLDHGDG